MAPAGPPLRHLTFTLDSHHLPYAATPPSLYLKFPSLSSYPNLRTLELVPGRSYEDSVLFGTFAVRLFQSLSSSPLLSHLRPIGNVGEPGKVFLWGSLLECLKTPAAANIRRLDFPTLDRRKVANAYGDAEWQKLHEYCDENLIDLYLRQELLSAGEPIRFLLATSAINRALQGC